MGDTTYDALPYEDFSFPLTHPERMFCTTKLFGLDDAPDFRTARVLEIGCANGANLVPMALDLPDASFVGIDLSAGQIESARALTTRLAIGNVRFEAESLTTFAAAPGSFDYVICHGVYSWTPPPVREALLALCARVLASNGVAYVSYNTLPGWSIGRSLRDFLMIHTERAGASPVDRVAAARKAVELLIEGISRTDEPTALAIRHEAMALRDVGDSYLFHEYLETHNDPMYFRDFAHAAMGAGVEHFCDADLARFAAEALTDGLTRDARIAVEQSVDFFRNRRFRASLLVRAGRRSPRVPLLEHLVPFHFATRAELAEDADAGSLRTTSSLSFTCDGVRFSRSAPFAKAALSVLVEAARRPVSFQMLCEEAARRSGVTDAKQIAHALAHELDLASLALDDIVTLHAGPARYADEAGLTPLGCPLARDQATLGVAVTNRRHAQLELEPIDAAVLRLADGHRDRSALAEGLKAMHRDGHLLGIDPHPNALAGRVEASLEWLALNALLIG